ncbi:MAG: phosphoribosyltransferase [Sulfolobales archaeon]|nr:phosphoribosyltransferase [Sulfolobales archaeon]MCX8198549.1 phosphoribosyltransferase [Sulfolobales archaeon]MDW8169622.1 phosphoribosyltransferase [Desulfurococcaceae archaeon]
MAAEPEVVFVDWSEVHKAVAQLAHRMVSDGFIPDAIYGVLKGGIIPARLLADIVNVDSIGFIGVKFYKSIGETRARPELTQPPTLPVRSLSILIVDDVVDSGRTLQLAIDELTRYGAREVRSAVIYLKPWSSFTPDYYYKVIDKWIAFPWEIGECLREGLKLNYFKEIRELIEETVRRL